MCKINVLTNPSGRTHTGCGALAATPVCDISGVTDSSTTGAGNDPVCRACTNDGATDTCNYQTGINFKSLGTCEGASGPRCNCNDGGDGISTNNNSPDPGCLSQNPSCVSNACVCGSSAGASQCGLTCSNPATPTCA